MLVVKKFFGMLGNKILIRFILLRVKSQVIKD